MTSATIRLSLQGDDGVPLVARLLGEAHFGSSEVVVPSRGAIDVPVASGEYTIQLILPSGRILQQDCAAEEGEVLDLSFDARGRSSTDLTAGERFDLQSAVTDAGADALVRAAARVGADISVADSAEEGIGAAGDDLRPSRTARTRAGRAQEPVQREAIAGRRLARGAKKFGGGPRQTPRLAGFAQRPGGKTSGSAKTAGSVLKMTEYGSPGPVGSPKARSLKPRTVAPAPPQPRVKLCLAWAKSLEGSEAWALAARSPGRWPKGTASTKPADPAAEPQDGVELWTFDPSQIRSKHRLWALAESRGDVELASLPLPWPCEEGPAAVNVLVDPRVGGAAMTSVALKGTVYGGLLSYVATGSISSVIPIIRHLEDTGAVKEALYGKRPNPLAVCVVAIARMATSPQEPDERWCTWLRDLMERNPAVPDCAIVYARSVVIRPGDLDEQGEAAKALARAYAAGIPYFSTALQLMRDMLFAGSRRDPELKGFLENVMPVVSRCDPRGLTTVLRYPAGSE